MGTKVIFNNEYIDELIRHRDIAKTRYYVETSVEAKEKAKQELDYWEDKLKWAEEFQDTIDEIKDMNIPKLTVVKTMSGHEYPAKYLQRI